MIDATQNLQRLFEDSPAARAVLTTIRRRRSFKLGTFKPDPVPRELLEQLLEAATWAPSHCATEPWRFAVFTGHSRAALGDAFAEAYRLSMPAAAFSVLSAEARREQVWKAPVWISLGAQVSGKVSELEDVLAVACAAQNLMLAATGFGLASRWVFSAPTTHSHTARFVGLQDPSRLLGFLHLGFPAAKWPNSTRAPIQQKVRWMEDILQKDSSGSDS